MFFDSAGGVEFGIESFAKQTYMNLCRTLTGELTTQSTPASNVA